MIDGLFCPLALLLAFFSGSTYINMPPLEKRSRLAKEQKSSLISVHYRFKDLLESVHVLMEGQQKVKEFKCRRCGECCLGRGGARLDEAGVRAAAAFLNLDEAGFRRLYLEPGTWDIGQDKDGYCRLRQADGLCRIHSHKPATCRLWPFLPQLLARESAFQDAKLACPGFRADLTWAEFKAAGSF